MSNKKNLAMYETIQQDIIDKIQCGTYHAGDRIPSEKEIMDTWNVSRTTAAKALTELSLNGYINRIQGKGSFANPLGHHIPPRQLSSLHQNTPLPTDLPRKIGVLIPINNDSHCGSITKGIANALSYPDYFVTFIHCYEKDKEDYILNQLIESNYAGIILFPADCELYNETVLQMVLSKYPLVLVDRTYPGIKCHSVTSDNLKGCSLAMSYLYELGHRNIAYVAGNTYSEKVAHTRYEGYHMFMRQVNLPTIEYEGFSNSAYAEQKQADFLKKVRSGEITAVIACNALTVAKLHSLCCREGISIPNDLSIVCFDRPSHAEGTLGDFFTYIDQESISMGIQAAQLIKRLIESDSPVEYEQISLTPRLVVMHSTKAI